MIYIIRKLYREHEQYKYMQPRMPGFKDTASAGNALLPAMTASQTKNTVLANAVKHSGELRMEN
jgi:hypothetical protein